MFLADRVVSGAAEYCKEGVGESFWEIVCCETGAVEARVGNVWSSRVFESSPRLDRRLRSSRMFERITKVTICKKDCVDMHLRRGSRVGTRRWHQERQT